MSAICSVIVAMPLPGMNSGHYLLPDACVRYYTRRLGPVFEIEQTGIGDMEWMTSGHQQ